MSNTYMRRIFSSVCHLLVIKLILIIITHLCKIIFLRMWDLDRILFYKLSTTLWILRIIYAILHFKIF